MKKLFITIIILTLLANIAYAGYNLRFNQIIIDEYSYPQDVEVRATVENRGTEKLKDLKVSAILLGPDTKVSKRIDSLKTGKKAASVLLVPVDDLEPGYYYLRITAEHKNTRRTRYREIVII